MKECTLRTGFSTSSLKVLTFCWLLGSLFYVLSTLTTTIIRPFKRHTIVNEGLETDFFGLPSRIEDENVLKQ